jgi:alpha-glucosidase
MKFILLVFFLFCCSGFAGINDIALLQSPDLLSRVILSLENGTPSYQILRDQTEIIRPSKLGVLIREKGDLSKNLELLGFSLSSHDETWEQPWGQNHFVRNNYNQILISLRHQPSRILLNIEFRVFNDGVAFRYLWPEQDHLKAFELDDELSEFRLNPEDQAWWIPAFQKDQYEYLFHKNSIESLDVVHTPLTVELKSGFSVSIHEARLLEYPSMALNNQGQGMLRSDLFPWADHVDAKLSTPHQSPWRTIQISKSQSGLIESTMILNLNDPSVIQDTSWIETGKYVGVWWGMHLGKYTWGTGAKHGATTAITKDYIDFAAVNGFKGVLAEGWNFGWDGDWTKNGDRFRFDQPTDDFNIGFLANYAFNKGVTIVGHHETAGNTLNYLSQLKSAFDFLNGYKINIVKTGHVNSRLDGLQWHHGQYGVNYYTKVMKYAAERKTMLIVHEPIKPTGLERTYPNLMASEGARGQEFDAWSEGNPPEHTTILPFTRGLAGPLDFTPGTFDLILSNDGMSGHRVRTTLAKQLALYVVIYSPWPMVSDLPENYMKFPKAFEFIKKVPTNWEKTKCLAAKIGDFAVIARQKRGTANWYLGAITDENSRHIPISLDFLEKDSWYTVNAFQDGPAASWLENPTAMEIYTTRVKGGGDFVLKLASGGGLALEFIKE